MLTQENDVDAHALRRQGWTITAIANHLDHDRKTIRAYLDGDRVAGQRAPTTGPDLFEPFQAYLKQRLKDDRHVWATTLFDEVVALGFPLSYPSFTRGLRIHNLRPHCEACSASVGRDHAIIDHPAGDEAQWDWLELPEAPKAWNVGDTAHLFVGALPHCGRWRGVLAESEDFAHLVQVLHQVSARLGGLPKTWRFDRMATVANPNTGKVTAAFAAVAKHYGVHVALCPPRHGNRKGTVEKANDSAAQRWWRTVPDDSTVAAAQASLDVFCTKIGDNRVRHRDGIRTSVGELATAETALLAPLPAPFPATLSVTRVVSAQALVAFCGNFYSVPPGLAGRTLVLTHRLGEPTLDIATGEGIVLARHHRQPDGAGMSVRDAVHVTALERAVLTEFSDRKPCKHKGRRPPSPAALAEAEAITTPTGSGQNLDRDVVVDLALWATAANDRQVAP